MAAGIVHSVENATTSTELSETSDRCEVCLLQPRADEALVPCSHSRFCSSCADTVASMDSDCPICRTTMRIVLHLYGWLCRAFIQWTMNVLQLHNHANLQHTYKHYDFIIKLSNQLPAVDRPFSRPTIITSSSSSSISCFWANKLMMMMMMTMTMIVFWSRIFRFYIFHPWHLVLHFQSCGLHFPFFHLFGPPFPGHALSVASQINWGPLDILRLKALCPNPVT